MCNLIYHCPTVDHHTGKFQYKKHEFGHHLIKLTVPPTWSRNSSPMEPDGSLLCSQESATDIYLGPAESSLYIPTQFQVSNPYETTR
jgi:hypothetical protein